MKISTALIAPDIENRPLPRLLLLALFGVSVVFNLCLVAQVLTVGLAYFSDASWWAAHVLLVRSYSGLSLLLLVGSWYWPFPSRIRALATSLPILLSLQFLTIHLPNPVPLAIFHPLIGFSLFYAATTLVHRMGHVLSPEQAPHNAHST